MAYKDNETPRFEIAEEGDSTGRTLIYANQSPEYAATIAPVLGASKTFVEIELTGNATLDADELGKTALYDEVMFIVRSAGGAFTITFNNNFSNTPTMAVGDGMFSIAQFVFGQGRWIQTAEFLEV